MEGDDFNEPISDAARSILDGHISLSRDLANKNHYPAVEVLQSISRVMIDIVDQDHRKMAGEVLNILATYKKAEDLINIGAYVKGSSREIDYASDMIERVNDCLRQQEIVEKVGQEVEKRRLALLEAVKNRKIMDKLRDRQLREHEATMALRERKTLDETAISRFVRNGK